MLRDVYHDIEIQLSDDAVAGNESSFSCELRCFEQIAYFHYLLK